jgi:hypothetical protein
MKARILDAQADLFEVGVLSQTAEVESVSMGRLLADPAGPPLVVVGGLLGAERLADMRKLSSGLARARVAVIVVPPFTDLDVGRYFETPVQLGVRRRAAESAARITEGALEELLGVEVKVRSDHFFDTALGAGVLAVDAQSKPVLLRYQATNTAAPVFFSALQLLTYTALTDEAHRQGLLGHLLSWTPSVIAEVRETSRQPSSPPKAVPPSRRSTASPEPVEAPAGAIARPLAPPARRTSTSTVGRPRESQTRRAWTPATWPEAVAGEAEGFKAMSW